MPKSPRRITVNNLAATKRPGLDMVAAKQADQFPGVGMTLPNYKYDSRDHHRRRMPASETIVKRVWWRRLRQRITLKRFVITLALLMLLIGGWLGGKFVYNAHKLFGGNILSIFSTTKLKGEDNGRVNILLAGNSADDVGHDGAKLTDSIMLISLDTKKNKAFLLSIPRDLWVHIPKDGHQKINAAYVVGDSNNFTAGGYPSGGMGELEQIVSQDLGITINYYALIDYSAIRQAVDAVGGIDVTIKSNDPRGLYDPSIDYATNGPLVKLTNGVHHLTGQQALDLGRARGDAYNSYGFAASDFDRTQHQRQMMVALKTKTESVGVLANPAKLSSLSDAAGNNIKTDFNLSEVHRLYDLSKQINNNDIQSLSLNNINGKNLLASYTSSDGQAALIPAAGIDNFYDIQAFIKKQMSSDPMVQEGANVAVLNGTSVSGLAMRVQGRLLTQNIEANSVGDALSSAAIRPTTTIIDNSLGKKPATLAALMKLFGKNVTSTNPYARAYPTSDFIIVVGVDQATQTSTSQ